MSSTEILNGNGEKVALNNTQHTLWQPKPHTGSEISEPLWYLRVSILKDHDGRGDCPSRRFAFKSLHHLTHAANQLEGMFGSTLDIRKCGIEAPDAMGGRVNDGRSEHITIEYDSDAAGAVGWQDFMSRLTGLEAEWEHEGMSVL